MRVLTIATLLGMCIPQCGLAAERDEQSLADLRERIEGYVSAFNEEDAEALADCWTDRAEYLHPLTDKPIQGREAISQAFVELFEEETDLRLSVSIRSLRLVEETVAIEDGIAVVVSPDAAPEQAAYTVVHVKRGNVWLRASVREIEIPSPASGNTALRELAWLVGDWSSDSDETPVRVRCQWTGGGSFLSRSFIAGPVAGTQIIGWDPVAQQIRSWTFDSEGGFSEGLWTWRDDHWVIRASAVTPDGQSGSEQRILTPDGEDRFTWKAVQREVGGRLLPATEEADLVRVAR